MNVLVSVVGADFLVAWGQMMWKTAVSLLGQAVAQAVLMVVTLAAEELGGQRGATRHTGSWPRVRG